MRHINLYILICFVAFSAILFGKTDEGNFRAILEARTTEIKSAKLSGENTVLIQPFKEDKISLEQMANEYAEKTSTYYAGALSNSSIPKAEQIKRVLKMKGAAQQAYLKQLKEGTVKTEKFDLVISSNMGKFIPDGDKLEHGEDIEYYDGKLLYLYSPINARIIIQKKDSLSGSKIGSYSYAFIYNSRFACNLLNNPEVKTDIRDDGIFISIFSNDVKTEALVDKQKFLLTYQRVVAGNISETKWSNFVRQQSIWIPMSSETHDYGTEVAPEVRVCRKISNIEINQVLRKEDFIPSGFSLCTVQDERFSPPLFYLAKGMLPSEEKIVAMASDKKLLEEHNNLMRKLAN